MKFSAKVSSLALAGVLMLSGSAIAQTMVAGQAVSEADLPKVQAQCDVLADAQNNADTTTTSTDTKSTETTPPADNATATDTTENSPEKSTDVNGTDAATSVFDLEILTYENCKEAGLVK